MGEIKGRQPARKVIQDFCHTTGDIRSFSIFAVSRL